MHRWRGHEIATDAIGLWRYCDNGRLVSGDPNRVCGHCGLPNTTDGYDGCLGKLPGVVNACCGHGVKAEAYTQYPESVMMPSKLWFLNFFLLQWFFIRLAFVYDVRDDGSLKYHHWMIIHGMWPLTGWWGEYKYLWGGP